MKPKIPTVVTVARIDPIKDLVTLIRAAEKVKEKLPEVRFLIYGSISVPSYYEECLQLIQKLGLEQTVKFAGHTSNIMQAYHAGDVVALSSISEAFPYSVIEAMMSGKAVVTTDVGGIGEALGDTGILVDPRNSVQLAEGLLKLLENERLRNSLGEEARRRALDYFTLDQVLEHYYKSYVKLALAAHRTETEDKAAKKRLPLSARSEPRSSLITEPSINVKSGNSQGNGPSYMSQKLLFEKGLAFMSLGDWKEALSFFVKAIEQEPASPLIPFLLSELATAWNELGDYEEAINEMEKMYTFLAMPHMLVQLA
jgi:tetratricopeptide (TPR) repeat protein